MVTKTIANLKDKEKVLLVVIDFKSKDSSWTIEEVRQEMTDLIVSCDGQVVDHIICKIAKPSASYLISEGKLQDVAQACQMKEVDTVVFSHDLKGSQQRNLEEVIRTKTIDRTQLILDIFAKHATSKEGKTQVELAQLEYLMPRLVGKGIELSRLGGGIGTQGPGETKLEVDRRRIAQRITKLQRSLKETAADRALKRKQRKDKGVPTISLVGYTNAGKSTLMNILTQAGQLTRDGLFTTLDSVTRQLVLPNHQRVVLSDTIGFMHDLPHRLIEAFKATLEEVREADLLLHVLDVSHPHFRHIEEAVMGVLKELEVYEKPTITLLNKIDKIKDRAWIEDYRRNFPEAVCISAATGENIPGLLEAVRRQLSFFVVEINVHIPIQRMDLVNLAHEQGEVYSIKYYADRINIRAAVPSHLAGRFYKHDLASAGGREDHR